MNTSRRGFIGALVGLFLPGKVGVVDTLVEDVAVENLSVMQMQYGMYWDGVFPGYCFSTQDGAKWDNPAESIIQDGKCVRVYGNQV